MRLLYAASSQQHLLYRDEFESFATRGRNFRFEPIVLQSSDIYPRLLAEAERRWIAADTDRSRQFYVCGVGKGVSALRDLLRGAGYERRSVHYEQW
jgi:ferredoxin-NADP reductase